MAFDKRTSSPTVFEQQREELVREIAVGMEQVLQNMNRLNRNLESVIAVGNEFGSVEALWSQFENFMGRPDAQETEGNVQGQVQEEAGGQTHTPGHSPSHSQDMSYEEDTMTK